MNIAPRELSPDERASLNLLLSADFEGAQELREQAPFATAIGKCDCGCPTIDLHVPLGLPRSTASSPIPAEAWVSDSQDRASATGGVLVFCTDGYLSSMEFYYYCDAPPAAWPPIEQLHED